MQQENAGIKVHVAFSNLTGAISHVTITEGSGSERAQVRAEEYAKGTLFTVESCLDDPNKARNNFGSTF